MDVHTVRSSSYSLMLPGSPPTLLATKAGCVEQEYAEYSGLKEQMSVFTEGRRGLMIAHVPLDARV